MDTANKRDSPPVERVGGRGSKVKLLLKREWDRAVAEFIARIASAPGGDIVGIIALSESAEVYNSNVPIIVRNKDPVVISKIISTKRVVERRFDDRILISPFVAGEEDERITRAFEEASRTSK